MDRYATLRDGLIAAYCPSLGATGNTLVDRSSRRNNATLVNMGGQVNWVGVQDGVALAFDGIDDRAEFTLPSITTSRFSIHGWAAYRNSPNAYAGLVFTRQAGIISGVYRSGAGSVLTSQWNDTPAEYGASTGLTITANKWFRFAMVVNDGTITTWMDDASFSLSITATARNIGGPWALGRDPFSTRFANCLMDDVRFYSRALTRSELAILRTGRRVGLMRERSRRVSAPAAPTTQFHVKVGGVWKPATTWIKVGGVWKTATPKINASGVWK